MKYSLITAALLGTVSLFGAAPQSLNESSIELIMPPSPTVINVACPENECKNKNSMHHQMHHGERSDLESMVLKKDRPLLVSVIGQGVAPMNTDSPAQAFALAKRAATADAYRLIAEKVKGVHVEGQDMIQNMMVKRSTVRTYVSAVVKNAHVVEAVFKEGLCEVEMEITLSHSQFSQ